MARIVLFALEGSSTRGRSVPRTRDSVIINDPECRGCGLCILACPIGCLEFAEEFNDLGYHPVRYSGAGCRADGLCSAACPRPGAIVVIENADPGANRSDR